MRCSLTRAVVSAAVLVLVPSAAPHAGQVRISVGLGGNVFAPSTIGLNRGDHVVWVWASNNHTVTSGNPTGCSADGTFNTGVANLNAAFTWKSTVTNAGLRYYCQPHCLQGMSGTLVIAASGTAVADIRITEVQYNVAGGLDLIELANFGGAAADLGRYRFVSSNGSATVPVNNFVVPADPDVRVKVHVNASGTQTAPTDLFLSTLPDLPTTGSLGLYVPFTVTGASVTDPNQIIDFVQWGAGGQTNEATAVSAGLWTAGQFVPTVGAGQSMEFCGTAGQYGAPFWTGVSSPNVGTNGHCATPTVTFTWGRLKTIYR